MTDEQLIRDYWAAQAQFGPFDKGPEVFVKEFRDRETIALFMEPRPDKGPFDFRPWRETSPGGWWTAVCHDPDNASCNKWLPAEISTLDRLRLVEERLTDEQWGTYADLLTSGCGDSLLEESVALIHASAEQKIRALAAVLRPRADGGADAE